MMTLSGGLLFLLAPTLMRIFTASQEVILLGALVLRMVAVSEPFYGVSIITAGMMQGAGHTLIPFIFDVSCMWIVRIGGTFLCVVRLGLGLQAAWGCMIAHNMTLFLLLGIHFLRGKWNPLQK